MGDKKSKSSKSSKLKKIGRDEKMVSEENGGDFDKSPKPKKKRSKSPEKRDNGKTRNKDKRHLSDIQECNEEGIDRRSSASKQESDDDFAVKKTRRIKDESDDENVAVKKTRRIKDESDDENFAVKSSRHKRKRAKEEPAEDLSISNASPTSKENRKTHEPEDGEPKKKKKKDERSVKKEEGEDRAVSKKSKRTKEKREEQGEGRGISKKTKRTKQEKKEEGGEEPISSKKPKKTKDEIEEAKRLKIQKKEEEEKNRWRWWEEEKYEDGVKWKYLEHKGPYFPEEYQPLPDNVRFLYNGTPVKLSSVAEEVALFFAQMLDHDYTTKDVFRQNFFTDWRKEMTHEERKLMKDLEKCDFGEMHSYHKAKVETRKNFSKEEKLVLKEANQKIVEEFGFCTLDHHRERIGNFKIEPPGLFRGRGEHPKQGMLKKRIQPEDVIINCSKEASIPVAPAGHRWKEVRHDNSVTWLASWTENIQGSIKYIMLNPSSKLKGEKDWEKYEIARKLKSCVESIRNQYQSDLKSKQMGTRQRAVALYFIDKLALRAGNEKEEGESADTVGCCSLRVEHITLHDTLEGSENVVEFDFLGKDSIRYYNKVPVVKKVFKSLKLFMENKEGGDDLFDRLTTQMLNKHLGNLMTGLTAKVFRTFNASITLQQQLKELSNMSDNLPEKLLSYNRANRAVAILCNHQRAPPKTFEQSMANLQSKIVARREQLALAKAEHKQAKKDAKTKDPESKVQVLVERKKKAVERCEDQLLRMEVQATDREENKQIALGTSKLNYLDPRISVAWCKNMDVPVDKIYNKTQRDKFAWALDMTEADFVF